MSNCDRPQDRFAELRHPTRPSRLVCQARPCRIGTLFAPGEWRIPPHLVLLIWDGLDKASRADMVENFLGYVPLGILLCLRLRQSLHRIGTVILTVLGGGLFSLALEVIQAFVPARDSSLLDLLINTIGTIAGGSCCSIS